MKIVIDNTNPMDYDDNTLYLIIVDIPIGTAMDEVSMIGTVPYIWIDDIWDVPGMTELCSMVVDLNQDWNRLIRTADDKITDFYGWGGRVEVEDLNSVVIQQFLFELMQGTGAEGVYYAYN